MALAAKDAARSDVVDQADLHPRDRSSLADTPDTRHPDTPTDEHQVLLAAVQAAGATIALNPYFEDV